MIMDTYKIRISVICAVVMLATGSTALAHWSDGDDYKMHAPQLPDSNGWDICLNHQAVADDFVCTDTGQIENIHFWVSWRSDYVDFQAITWTVKIYDNAEGQPGKSLWTLGPRDGSLSIDKPRRGIQGWHCLADYVRAHKEGSAGRCDGYRTRD